MRTSSTRSFGIRVIRWRDRRAQRVDGTAEARADAFSDSTPPGVARRGSARGRRHVRRRRRFEGDRTGGGDRVGSRRWPVVPRVAVEQAVLAAVEDDVAGGLELAIWCDALAVERVFGVYAALGRAAHREEGTVRLSRMLGHSHALALDLTERR